MSGFPAITRVGFNPLLSLFFKDPFRKYADVCVCRYLLHGTVVLFSFIYLPVDISILVP